MTALAAVGLASARIVEALLWTSLQGALFIAIVWLVCRLFPRLPATVRCGLWWAACLKLLVGLVWISPVELPLLPAVPDSHAVSDRTVSGAAGALTSPVLLSQPPPRPPGEEGERQEKWGLRAPSLPAARGGGWERGGWGSEGLGRRETVGFGRAAGVGVLVLWLAGLALQAVRSVRHLRQARWVVRRAEPIRDGWIRTAFAELCTLLALRRRPELLGSRDVRTPQAIGLVRPRVLLPDSGLARLSPAEVSMTLCHELVHLRRGDLWLGWVPALAHRIFFFHPLAALAVREYAIAREAACDAEVLRVLGSAPQAYGRLLLRWGVAPRETGLAAAGASPSLQNLKRRLQMLQQISERRRRLSGWWWLAGVAVVVGLIPLRIVAQQAVPAEPAVEAEAAVAPEDAVEPEEPVAAVEPEEPVAVVEPGEPAAVVEGVAGGIEGGVAGGVPGGISGGIEGGVAGGVAGAIPGGVAGGVAGAVPGRASRPTLAPPPGRVPASARPAVAMAPASPGPVKVQPALARAPLPGAPVMAALPAGAPGAPREESKGRSNTWRHSDNGDSYVLLYGNGSSTMSGSWRDMEKAKRLRGDSKEPFLWFERDGREYVVRDAAVLKQVREIFRPQMELGAQQGALGARQGELGSRQGALGAQQGALGGQQGALAAQMAVLATGRIGRDGDDADLERRQRDLDRKIEDLSEQQEELGRQQAVLGRQQAELGEQQAELGRQQEAASEKAQRELRSLIEKAIRSGAAQEVR
jgi:bla regulator protein blaR1